MHMYWVLTSAKHCAQHRPAWVWATGIGAQDSNAGEVQQATKLALEVGEASDGAFVGVGISMLLGVGSGLGLLVDVRVGVWVGFWVDELAAALTVGEAIARA